MNGVNGSRRRRTKSRLVEGSIVKDFSRVVMSSSGVSAICVGRGMVHLVMKDCVFERLCNRTRFSRYVVAAPADVKSR